MFQCWVLDCIEQKVDGKFDCDEGACDVGTRPNKAFKCTKMLDICSWGLVLCRISHEDVRALDGI